MSFSLDQGYLRRMYRSARFAEQMFEAMEESVIVTDDAVELPGPRIIFVNRAFERMTGYQLAEVLGRDPCFLQGPRTDQAAIDELRAALLDKRASRGCAINYKKDGTPFLNQWYIKPIVVDGVTLFLGIQRDVTEERHLFALAQVTSSTESAAFMVAGLRHELGNPINSLKAAVFLLRDQLATLPPERMDYYLAAMQRELSRIELLLKGLRSMNAFETASPSWIDLADNVKSVFALASPVLREQQAEWVMNVDEGTHVYADARSLHQILVNVVKNAIEAMRDEGRIEVAYLGDSRSLTIQDNGHGISSERFQTLFSPFITTKEGGSGLGLYVARRMAADMGCQLTVESALGQGTTVTLTFPPSTVSARGDSL